MRFTCSKTDLWHGVQIASKATPSSTSEPVFLNVLLKAEGKRLTLSATDNRISIREGVLIASETEGEIALRASLFQDILQGFQTVESDEISFEADDNFKVHLTATGASYKISGESPKNLPVVPSLESDRTFVLPASRMKEMIRQTAIVAASGSSSHTFEDVLLEARDGKLTTVATDSVRLAIKELAFEKADELPDFDIRMPLSALVELSKILPSEGDVKVIVGDDQVCFTFGETEFMARLSDKTFPNYRQIIPREHSRNVVVSRKAFVDNLKGVIPLARENKHKVHLKFSSEGITIVSVSPEIGEARREMDAKVEGEEIELAFNARYLLDFLGAVDTDTIELGLTSSIYPSTMRPTADVSDFTYILMPINL